MKTSHSTLISHTYEVFFTRLVKSCLNGALKMLVIFNSIFTSPLPVSFHVLLIFVNINAPSHVQVCLFMTLQMRFLCCLCCVCFYTRRRLLFSYDVLVKHVLFGVCVLL